MRRDVALLVTIELVEGEPTSRHVVHSPPGLIAVPRRYGGPFLQPVAQHRWGELTLVPVGYRGEEGERAPEEPCQVRLWRLLRRCINTDVQVRYPVRRRGNHIDGRPWGEAFALQNCGVEVMCGVVWCGVVWCAEGAVTKRQRPGCLPTGTGKRAGLCVLCARCV